MPDGQTLIPGSVLVTARPLESFRTGAVFARFAGLALDVVGSAR